jgi:hypothetical protein
VLITPSRAIADPRLLGRGFPAVTLLPSGKAIDSWARWRAILKAAYGEPLDLMECSLFRAVAAREAPSRPVKEAWFIIGRRGGKDSIAAAIAVTAAMGDYRQYLRPGEIAVICCLAVDKTQAKIVLGYIKASFFDNGMLSALIRRETEFGLELETNIEIMVLASNFRSVRGRTVLCCILDECAYWRDENYANPDAEIYAAIRPGMVTIPNSILIGISTAYRKSGLLYEKFRDHYAKDDPDILVVKATTRQFNPTIPQAFIDDQLRRDPEVAASEYLSEWRADLADFVQREVIEAAVLPDCHEIPYKFNIRYVGFVDPSGGSSDSMTLAVAHNEAPDRVVLDCLREIRPPFSPESAVGEFAATLAQYKIARVTGDRYAGEWPREQFRKRGIHYQLSEKSKSDIYRDALPLFNSSRIQLLDHQRLVNQLTSLERRTGRGTGRDIIDHPAGQHDDLANSACGALGLAHERKSAYIDPEVVARSARIFSRPMLGDMRF